MREPPVPRRQIGARAASARGTFRTTVRFGVGDDGIELLALAAIVVTPTQIVELVRDADDDRLIEAALAAHADVIVTGDQDLLTLERVQIRILAPRQFLETLQHDT